MRKTKRILAGLMTLCMLLGMFSVTAFAGDEETTGGIESKLVFDLEIDPVNKTATDVKNSISVNVLQNTNAVSEMTWDKIDSDQGEVGYVTITNKESQVADADRTKMATNKLFNGIYVDSDKFIGDEITIEAWINTSLRTISTWGSHVFGLMPYSASGSAISQRQMEMEMAGNKPQSCKFAPRGMFRYSYSGKEGSLYELRDSSCNISSNGYIDKWSQIVITRKWDSDIKRYKQMIYYNAPGAEKYKSVEMTSKYAQNDENGTVKGESYEGIAEEASGRLYLGMPYDAATSTNETTNREVDCLKIANVKIYQGIMTEDEAYTSYTANKSKYINIASVSPENGSKLAAGSKTITVTYESSVAEANRSKLAIAEGSATLSDATTSWSDDGKTATLKFNAQMRKTYTLTYPLGDTTGTATYTTVGDIEETKVFDLEIDPVTKTAKDTVSNIGVHVQEATGENPRSGITAGNLITANGNTTPYLKSENYNIENNIGGYAGASKSFESEQKSGTELWSGIYTDASDKFAGDELTLEAWVKIDEYKISSWGSHLLGMRSVSAAGSDISERSMGLTLTTLNQDESAENTDGRTLIRVEEAAFKYSGTANDGHTKLGNIAAEGNDSWKGNYEGKWTQIVLTRRWDATTGQYKQYIYLNGDKWNFTSTELTSKPVGYSTVTDYSEVTAESKGVLYLNMPWNGSTTNSSYDCREANLTIGDVRVYKGVMTQQEAINIYNRDALKYVDISEALTDNINLLNVACYEGDTKLDGIAGKANVSIKGSIYSKLDKDVKLFAALYKSDNTLSDVKLADVKNGATTVDVSFNNASADAGYVRLYVWDAASLEPYMVSKTIGVPNN